MSSPFPLEDAEQLDGAGSQGVWDPWKGAPAPHWYSGMGFDEDTAYLGPMYRALEAAGAGAAKGEELLGGFYHGAMEGYAALAQASGSKYLESDAAQGLQEGQAIEQDAQERVKAMTPDPATTGAAVQLLHGVVSGAYRMVAGSLLGGPLGGAVLLGGSEAVSRYHELTQQGVDSGTAAESAAGTGALQGVAALIPGGFGSTLMRRIASGLGSNVGLGLASRYTDHAILEHGGYTDMADQERVWDRGQVMADAVLGAAFGGLAHLHASAEQARMLEATRDLAEASGGTDAARVMELAAADRDAAPGVPADPEAAAAHQAALEKASADLLQGEPVNVADTGIAEANLLSRPERPSAELGREVISAAFERANVAGEQQSLQELEAALAARLRGERPATAERLSGAPQAPSEPVQTPAPENEVPTTIAAEEIPRATELVPQEREIESRFAEQLAADPEAAVRRYAELPDSQGGKVLNTDTARELSPDYLADRTRSAAVHEPASWLVKHLYAEQLARAPAPGEEPAVLLMGGGTGAGKSTAIKNALGPVAEHVQTVLDSNMNSTRSAEEKVDQALAAGKHVKIAYVFRDPIEALKEGALTRAMHQEARYGTGRTVPIEEHVRTHVGSNEAIRAIAERYKNDPRVTLSVLDNSRGKGAVREIPLDELPHLDYNQTREQAHQSLDAELEAGRISPSVYRGFAGHEPGEPRAEPPAGESELPGRAAGELLDRGTDRTASSGRQSGSLGAAAGRQPEPQRPGERSDELAPRGPVDPLAEPARQAIQENPNLQIPGDDGAPVNAAQALAEADRAVADAERDVPKALTAAVNCSLRKGS